MVAALENVVCLPQLAWSVIGEPHVFNFIHASIEEEKEKKLAPSACEHSRKLSSRKVRENYTTLNIFVSMYL